MCHDKRGGIAPSLRGFFRAGLLEGGTFYPVAGGTRAASAHGGGAGASAAGRRHLPNFPIQNALCSWSLRSPH
jgi:hypothetical protein